MWRATCLCTMEPRWGRRVDILEIHSEKKKDGDLWGFPYTALDDDDDDDDDEDDDDDDDEDEDEDEDDDDDDEEDDEDDDDDDDEDGDDDDDDDGDLSNISGTMMELPQ